MNRVFSGIQPTGIPHIGNYFGALDKWVKLQNSTNKSIMYCIVDLHAITVPYEPKELKKNVYDMAASMLGTGIDPNKCIFFRQSDVKQHAELSWILTCTTPLGWLNRMTQFKQKGGQEQEKATLGLLSYPVLMAADVLLYKATHIPVGDDQLQHLELARQIATTFNDRAKMPVFPKPQPLIQDTHCSRILNLVDPSSKMSKSSPSSNSRIDLTDSATTIQRKIRKAQTDGIKGISYNPIERPGVSNLLAIYSATREISIDQALIECQEMDMKTFKQALSDTLIAKIVPIGDRIRQYQSNHDYIDTLFEQGAKEATAIAQETMQEIKKVTGFL